MEILLNYSSSIPWFPKDQVKFSEELPSLLVSTFKSWYYRRNLIDIGFLQYKEFETILLAFFEITWTLCHSLSNIASTASLNFCGKLNPSSFNPGVLSNHRCTLKIANTIVEFPSEKYKIILILGKKSMHHIKLAAEKKTSFWRAWQTNIWPFLFS